MNEIASKVSIIITTYNRPHLLPRALESVLNQTYKDLEIIVVDDNDPETNSRINTEKVISNYKNDSRIIYLLHDKNRNASTARNTGIKASTGKYLSFLDDDDYYLPAKTFRLVSVLEENPVFSGIYCGWKRGNEVFAPVEDNCLIQNLLLGNTSIYTPTTLLKKEAVLSINGWDEKVQRHQDSEFIIRLISKGYKLYPLKEVLVVIDESDRTNAPRGRIWEESTRLFLEQMDEHILKFDAIHKGFKKQVYCNRYLSIMLNYLKNKKPIEALSIYISYSFNMPICFNKTLFNYIVNKLKYTR